jgi:hypothetical protein
LRTLIGHVKVIELTGVTDCDVSKHTLQTWGDILSLNKPRQTRHINTIIHTDTTLHKKMRISHTSRNEGTDDSPFNSNLQQLQKPCENITYCHIGRAKPRYCGTDTALDCSLATTPRHSAATIAAEVGKKITHARVALHTFTKILLPCTYIRTHTV